MNKQTIEAVLRIANCCSDDQTRYHLSNVAMDRGENGSVRLRATDGHCLVEMRVEDSDLAMALGDKTFLISEANRRALKEIIRGVKYPIQFPAEADPLGLRVGLKDAMTVIPSLVQKHEFPDTDRVTPGKAAHRLSFNVDRLMDIAKAVCTGKDKIVVIDMGSDPVRTPMKVTGSDPTRQWGILMPCRADKLSEGA